MKKNNIKNCYIENVCKCGTPDWSKIMEKPLTGGSVSTSDTPLLVYQICQKCKFVRILAN